MDNGSTVGPGVYVGPRWVAHIVSRYVPGEGGAQVLMRLHRRRTPRDFPHLMVVLPVVVRKMLVEHGKNGGSVIG